MLIVSVSRNVSFSSDAKILIIEWKKVLLEKKDFKCISKENITRGGLDELS